MTVEVVLAAGASPPTPRLPGGLAESLPSTDTKCLSFNPLQLQKSVRQGPRNLADSLRGRLTETTDLDSFTPFDTLVFVFHLPDRGIPQGEEPVLAPRAVEVVAGEAVRERDAGVAAGAADPADPADPP